MRDRMNDGSAIEMKRWRDGEMERDDGGMMRRNRHRGKEEERERDRDK